MRRRLDAIDSRARKIAVFTAEACAVYALNPEHVPGNLRVSARDNALQACTWIDQHGTDAERRLAVTIRSRLSGQRTVRHSTE